MPSTIEGSESMLRMMKTSIQKKFQAQPLLLEALDQHKQATHLICNPRFAALLFKRIAEYHRVEVGRRLFTSRLLALTCLDTHHAPPAHSCLDTHIVQVARDFRRVNAMSSKDQDGVAECYTLALALLFRPAEDGTPLSVDERALFSSAGVLTDRSRWHRSGNLLPLDYVRVEGSEYDDGLETMILIAPKRGRFHLSMAQQVLFRMAYGFGVLESAVSWQRYEVIVAEYSGVVLAGHKGRKLRDIMMRFGYKSDGAKKSHRGFWGDAVFNAYRKK